MRLRPESQDIVITISQFPAASGVTTRAARDGFGIHKPLDGREVPDQITAREFAFPVCPVNFVRRNATHDIQRAVTDSFVRIEEGREVVNFQPDLLQILCLKAANQRL
jgi:hypothetical protein